MSDQIPFTAPSFPTPDLVENTEPRCPVVLLVDTSGSMGGQPIQELNDGLQAFKQSLMADPLAQKRVEIAVIHFGDTPVVLQDFITADQWVPQHLTAAGSTGLGASVIKGLDLIEERKAKYKAAGVQYYRPWVMLMTDGSPTDTWSHVPSRVHAGESGKKFMFFAVGVGSGCDMGALTQIAPPNRPPLKLQGLAFAELFRWLSASMSSVSKSRVDEQVQLPSPTGWGTTT